MGFNLQIPFVFLFYLVAFSAALKCKFATVDLMPANVDNKEQQEQKKSDEKEYECPKKDKYCVVLGGVLTTSPKNFTFSLRSCESDAKRYMDPISEKIKRKLDYACQNADGKNHTVGPLTYWWNCCTSDDCNSAAFVHYNAIGLLSLMGICLLLGSMLVAY